MSETLQLVLKEAKSSKLKSYALYENFKSRIGLVATSSREYEEAIQQLCRIAKV